MAPTPGTRGTSTYSYVRVPLTPASVRSTRSVTSGGKASKPGGITTSGSASMRRLPRPATTTVKVTASLTCTLSRSRVVVTSRSPTNPVKSSGRPPGSGSTSISTGREAAAVEMVELSSDPRPKKSSNGSKAERRRTRTCASMPSGSRVRVPEPVGKSATFRMVAVVYCMPSRTVWLITGSRTGGYSSTQNPVAGGSWVMLYELTSTRVKMR